MVIMDDKKKKLVPVLRFSEFEENLKKIKFGEVILSNIYGPRFNANDYNNDGNVKTIRGTDIGLDGEIKYNQVPIAEIDAQVVLKHKLEDGDLIMITTADCGMTGVFRQQNIEYIASAYAVKIKLKKNVFSYYLKYFFQTSISKKEIKGFIRKATVANLPASDILKIKINLPTLPEQQKIANFLSSVDKKIEQLRQKVSLLEDYKKGVMQQIFSQQIRFKDDNGEAFADWEVKKLGEVCSLNPKSKLLPNSFIYIDLESVNKGVLQKENIIYKKDAPSRAQRLLQKNDILFQTVRPYQKNNLFFYKDGDYVASTGYAQIRTKNNSKYLYQYLHTEEFVNKVLVRCTGTSYPAINSKDLAKVKVNLPSLPEQKKIANYLSSLDDKIQQSQQQLEQVQQFKKGLLQQLFV